MRALVATEAGGPEVLAVRDVPDAESRPDRVLIEVETAGLGFADTLIIRGRYQVSPDFPFTPGFEVAGRVRSAPEDSGFAVGQQVIAFVGTGGFAELALAQPQFVLARPPRLSGPQAGGFLGNAHTAYYSLVDRGHLDAGDTLLVHGASGGVGLASIQLAAVLGARSIAVVSSEERGEVARTEGANEVVLAGADWPDKVQEIAGHRGVDVVLDTVGHDRAEASLKVLRPGGRLLVVGFASGDVPKLPLQRVLNSDADVVGVAWTFAAEAEPGLTARIGAALEPLLAEGKLQPRLGGVFPLERAAEAYRALEERSTNGKLVLDVAG